MTLRLMGRHAMDTCRMRLFCMPAAISYCASKHALNGFFEGLRLELNYMEIDVHVTLLLIGAVATDHAIDILKSGQSASDDFMAIYGDPAVAASVIMTTSCRKQTSAYYPWAIVRTPEIMHTISRDLFDFVSSKWMFPELRSILL
ncbi:hydroxysteroid 11-beta-dehydrogenase 1-like protein [Saccoglossus kowalevskii]